MTTRILKVAAAAALGVALAGSAFAQDKKSSDKMSPKMSSDSKMMSKDHMSKDSKMTKDSKGSMSNMSKDKMSK
jgi:pentapeptide MXKDX repeat protein